MKPAGGGPLLAFTRAAPVSRLMAFAWFWVALVAGRADALALADARLDAWFSGFDADALTAALLAADAAEEATMFACT